MTTGEKSQLKKKKSFELEISPDYDQNYCLFF